MRANYEAQPSRSWRMKMVHRISRLVILVATSVLAVWLSGIYLYFLQENYFTATNFNLHSDSIAQLLDHRTPDVAPLYNFTYGFRLTNDRCACRVDGHVELLYIVKSRIANRAKRQAIRQTWGNENRFGYAIKVVFSLALPVDGALQSDIDGEFEEFGDIIQGNFEDRYFNTTQKTIMAFNWVTHNCACAKYIFFADDDFYVSTKNLLQVLGTSRTERYLYMGYRFFILPLRFYYHKFFVSLEEYPYNMFPPFIHGGAFVVSYPTLLAFYYATLYTKPFKLDDVYVGLLARKVDVTPTHNRYFYNYRIPSSALLYKDLIASHGFVTAESLVDEFHRQVHFGNA